MQKCFIGQNQGFYPCILALCTARFCSGKQCFFPTQGANFVRNPKKSSTYDLKTFHLGDFVFKISLIYVYCNCTYKYYWIKEIFKTLYIQTFSYLLHFCIWFFKIEKNFSLWRYWRYFSALCTGKSCCLKYMTWAKNYGKV